MSHNILKSVQDNSSIINNEQSYLPSHRATLGLAPAFGEKILLRKREIYFQRFSKTREKVSSYTLL